MTILDRTKEVSKLRGLSLTETAIKAGLADKSIYSWDRSTPKADNLEKVANVLNVSTDYLLGRTDEMHTIKTEYPTTDLNDQPILSFDGELVSDEARQKILEYAHFVMEQEKGKNGK